MFVYFLLGGSAFPWVPLMHLGHQHVVGMVDFRVLALQHITLKCFFLLFILLKLSPSLPINQWEFRLGEFRSFSQG